MPLTERQIEEVQKYVDQIIKSPNGEGMISIEIVKGHPRRIYLQQTRYLPKPEDVEDDER